MRFLIDENIRKEVRDFLEKTGHDILILPCGSPDEKIAQIAKRTKRIILTNDQHFANILVYPPKKFSGIIRIKIHPPSAIATIESLHNLLSKTKAKDLKQKLVILEIDGFRIR